LWNWTLNFKNLEKSETLQVMFEFQFLSWIMNIVLKRPCILLYT